MKKTAFLFPGQGSQVVGMGEDIFATSQVAAEVLASVESALGDKLGALMRQGPDEDLRLTRNAQPALMTTSLACVKTLEERLGSSASSIGVAVAGHSLGEYSALAAVGSLNIGDAARLLRLRGEAMQEAVPPGEGAMAALLGVPLEEAQDLLKSDGLSSLAIANDNAPGQVVISGKAGEVDAALVLGKERGIKKAIKLPVSAPFHCGLMAPAADAMAEALAGVTLSEPSLPIWSNITAKPETSPEVLRTNLVAQVTGRVRWRETLLNMAEDGGISRFVEIGTGKVLTGLVKRTLPDAEALSLETSEEIDSFVSLVKGK